MSPEHDAQISSAALQWGITLVSGGAAGAIIAQVLTAVREFRRRPTVTIRRTTVDWSAPELASVSAGDPVRQAAATNMGARSVQFFLEARSLTPVPAGRWLVSVDGPLIVLALRVSSAPLPLAVSATWHGSGDQRTLVIDCPKLYSRDTVSIFLDYCTDSSAVPSLRWRGDPRVREVWTDHQVPWTPPRHLAQWTALTTILLSEAGVASFALWAAVSEPVALDSVQKAAVLPELHLALLAVAVAFGLLTPKLWRSVSGNLEEEDAYDWGRLVQGRDITPPG